MKRQAILDTGPLVAALNRHDAYHDWAIQQMASVRSPVVTCEAVISEAGFLLHNRGLNAQAVVKMVNNGYIEVPFHLDDEAETVEQLMDKYTNVPMSFADACLVKMAEQYPNSAVLTLDNDFRIKITNGYYPCKG
ncbi:MAG: pilus assembly protein [Candidatus Parabeggiatoa sp. nov. 1]|nr:MAG: pilus assembly protein [Gammaproteobacteria bacterium]